MKIKFDKLVDIIEINKHGISEIVIENGKYLYKILINLYLEAKNSSTISLYDDDFSEISFSNIEFIKDVIGLDFNTRSNLTALYKLINKSLIDSSLSKKIDDVNKILIEELEKFSLDFFLPIQFEQEMESIDYLKMLKVSISENYTSLLEKILEYIKTISILRNVRIIISFNITDFLEIDEIRKLNEQLIYDEIFLINLTSNFSENRSKIIKTFIIDHSLSLIE